MDVVSPEVEKPSGARLGRDALIYGLAFVLSRAAGFIMLPVYTRYLSPEDYGTLSLLQMSLDVATILLSSGVTAGVYRFYFKADTERERRAVVVMAWLMMTALNVLGAIGLFIASPVLAERVLDDPSRAPLVWIVAISFALDPCVTVPSLLMQVRQRSMLYSVSSIARLLLQLTLNVVFLVVLKLGVRGILLSTVITYVVLSLPMLVWFFRQLGFVLSRTATRDLWRFGLPYRVTEAGTFILTYVDRYFLLAAWGLYETGVYSLAYQFGFLVGYLGTVPFLLAWNPQRFQMVSEPREVRDRFFNQGFRYLTGLVVTLAVGISLFVGPVLSVMSDPKYHDAAPIVPYVMAAYVAQGWTQVLEFGIQVSERTKFVTIATWIAVGVIFVLYATLIPPLGALGAALATLLAFLVRLVAFAWFAQRLWPVSYVWTPHLLLASYGVLVVAAYLVLAPVGLANELAAAVPLCLVYFALLWGGGVLGREDRATIAEFVRSRARRVLGRTG